MKFTSPNVALFTIKVNLLYDIMYYLCYSMLMDFSKESLLEQDHEYLAQRELVSQNIEIPGEKTVLRPLTIEDAEEYYSLIAFDPEHLSQFGDRTAEKYQSPIDVEKSITNPEIPNKLRFGIWDKDKMVGSINLSPTKPEIAEIGYWIGKEHVGQGFASDALQTLTDFAFEVLEFKQLQAVAVSDNRARETP